MVEVEAPTSPKKGPLTVTTSTFDGVARKAVQLTYLPQPDALHFQLPTTHIALITNEGSALTSAVYNVLQERGNKVVVLNFPNTQFAQGVSIDVPAATDEAIQAALVQVHEQHGKVGTFIHLHPHRTFAGSHFTQHFQQECEDLKMVFLLAKHLQPDLNELGTYQQRANFLTVTRLDGQLGLGKRSNTSIVGGGLSGLVKCLNLEWSSVYCRAVDIQPEWSHKKMAQRLLKEVYDANRSVVEVALSDKGRFTLSGKAVPVQERQQIATTVREDAVWLVSGGARGVTANCVIELAQTFGGKFILLGRSDASIEVPAFAQTEDNAGALNRLIMQDLKARGETPNLATVKKRYQQIVAKKEIDATLQAIEAAGGQGQYVKGDVTQLSTIQTTIQSIERSWGAITGVIHGAGRLADKYIQDKTAQDFHNVLSVKLDGLLTLLQCVNINQLEHLILFSSVAGFYGNVGQSDYAIANEILSKAAHLFKTNHPNTHVSAINWGAWDAGMVSDALKKKFKEMGVTLVSSHGGPAMLVHELQTAYAEEPQVIIGGTLPAGISYTDGALLTHHVDRTLLESDNPFLQDHVIQGHPVLPIVNAVSWMTQTAEQLYPDFLTHQVKDSTLYKGIVFDGTQSQQYTTVLQETTKNAEYIVLDIKIQSQQPGAKLPTFHYSATVTLRSKQVKINAPKHTVQLNRQAPISKATTYSKRVLFHGPVFQGIQQILDITPERMVLECVAAHVEPETQGQFTTGGVNPFFIDIQYQGMLFWVDQYHNGAFSLPLSTAMATLYRPVPFDKILWVQIDIIDNKAHKAIANFTCFDPKDGTVYLQVEHAAVTISKDLTW